MIDAATVKERQPTLDKRNDRTCSKCNDDERNSTLFGLVEMAYLQSYVPFGDRLQVTVLPFNHPQRNLTWPQPFGHDTHNTDDRAVN